MTALDQAVQEDIDRIVSGDHHDPHRVLGAHAGRVHGPDGRVVVRAWRPA
jgi:alpha-1,4-glucan branching enzyme GlgB, N-terminal domain